MLITICCKKTLSNNLNSLSRRKKERNNFFYKTQLISRAMTLIEIFRSFDALQLLVVEKFRNELKILKRNGKKIFF